jgi:hypothetical protein
MTDFPLLHRRRPGPALWLAAASIFTLGASLGGCGRVGALEQPAPLYGEKAKAEYRAKKAAEAAAAKNSQDDGQPEKLAPDTPGPDGPNGEPSTLRAKPAPGALPLPNAAEPKGVLPDPYTHPQ